MSKTLGQAVKFEKILMAGDLDVSNENDEKSSYFPNLSDIINQKNLVTKPSCY